MMAVLSGLQHSSIMRLRKTYDKVDKKHMRVSHSGNRYVFQLCSCDILLLAVTACVSAAL